MSPVIGYAPCVDCGVIRRVNLVRKEPTSPRCFPCSRDALRAVTDAASWMDHFGDWFVPIPETGCWVWMKACTAGYGTVRFRGKQTAAHRVSFELLRGPIPPGLQIDHLCRVRCCVNPDHMDVVTQRENVRRGVSFSAKKLLQTHCIHGHEFTAENTYRFPGLNTERNSKRNCKACAQTRQLRRKERLRCQP